MALLQPAALWLLLLVAILLLLARRQTARVRRPVANLYLWAGPSSSASTEVRFTRLRRHWLVILQAAIVSLIVVALAHPMLSWSSRPLALVVDLTASMAAQDAGGNRMDQARRAALNAIGAWPRGARVRLFTAGRFTADLGEFATSDPRLAAVVDGLRPTASSGDIARTIRAVRTTVGAASITVISDHRDPLVTDAGVGWVIVGRPAGNQAITQLSARRLPAVPKAGQVITTIWNHAPAAAARDVEITQDGRQVSRQAVMIGAHGSTTIVTDMESIGGVIRARLEGRDALSHDDERATIVPAIERARVRLVGSPGFFLERALTTNPNLSLAGETSAPPDDVHVVVCHRCGELPLQGRSVLVIRAVEGLETAPLFVSLPDHPVAAMLEPGAVMAAGADTGEVPAGADVVLRAGQHPAVIAYEAGARRVVEVRLNLAATSFPLHPVFPVLLDNAFRWLLYKDENPITIEAGEPLRWRLASPSAAKVSISGPDGRTIDSTMNGGILTATETGATGLYTIHSGAETHRFVVNAVSGPESDLSRGDSAPDRTADALPQADTISRWDLGPFLVVLALALLVLEWRARVGRTRVA